MKGRCRVVAMRKAARRRSHFACFLSLFSGNGASPAFRSVDEERPLGARAHGASIKSSTLVIVRYLKTTKNEYSMIDTVNRFSERLFKSHS